MAIEKGPFRVKGDVSTDGDPTQAILGGFNSVLGLLGLPLQMSASISIATTERTFQIRR
jgi:hypothetical protein